eukprot:11155961-Lingulodinium_polyedra.AAC.1
MRVAMVPLGSEGRGAGLRVGHASRAEQFSDQAYWRARLSQAGRSICHGRGRSSPAARGAGGRGAAPPMP